MRKLVEKINSLQEENNRLKTMIKEAHKNNESFEKYMITVVAKLKIPLDDLDWEVAKDIWDAAQQVEWEACAEFVSTLNVFGSCELQEQQCNRLKESIAFDIRARGNL